MIYQVRRLWHANSFQHSRWRIVVFGNNTSSLGNFRRDAYPVDTPSISLCLPLINFSCIYHGNGAQWASEEIRLFDRDPRESLRVLIDNICSRAKLGTYFSSFDRFLNFKKNWKIEIDPLLPTRSSRIESPTIFERFTSSDANSFVRARNLTFIGLSINRKSYFQQPARRKF